MNYDDPKNYDKLCKHCGHRLVEHANKYHEHGDRKCPGTGAWDAWWIERDTSFEPVNVVESEP